MMSRPAAYPDCVDVFIVGGGPTSLVTTLLLLKGGIRVLAVEQNTYSQQVLYGRAGILHSRSLELLDMIGIYDCIADIGFSIREAATYKDGREIKARGWNFMLDAVKGKTFFDFSLSIRQRYVENALRDAIQHLDKNAIRSPVTFANYSIDHSAPYPVCATIHDSQGTSRVRCKYLIGADGGHSTVRRLAGIGFPGVNSGRRWVRMDAIVETDMPYPRRGVSLESKEYGNVLWNPSDNGRTRVGFVCPDRLFGPNGEPPSSEALMQEATRAVQPFALEFLQLDWWTIYAVGQRVAEQFRVGPVMLAGDAAHTHSSGAGQGMNTGIHDATNLAWKLAGVLKGHLHDCVLDTYDVERRASAQHLIHFDKEMATLISGIIPSHFNAAVNADPNVYLEQVLRENAAFTIGLGISYADNILNSRGLATSASTSCLIGHRAPDAAITRAGVSLRRRLHEFLPYVGRFWILVFVGELVQTSIGPRLDPRCSGTYCELKQYLGSPESFLRTLAPVFEFLTIARGSGARQCSETLGEQPLGKTVFDETGDCYDLYGVNATSGALIVVRPDGIVGLQTVLHGSRDLELYFTRVVRRAAQHEILRHPESIPEDTRWTFGEVSIDGEHKQGLRRWIGAKL